MEGELERLQHLNDGLTNDLARFHEREALEAQARSLFVTPSVSEWTNVTPIHQSRSENLRLCRRH